MKQNHGELHVLRPRDVDDEELVERARQKDPHAASLIWHKYSSLVRGLLYRSIGPHADIEDLVQEVFLRFFDKVGELRDKSALRSFLVGVALRVAGTALRRRRVRRWMFLTETGAEMEVEGVADDPEAREALKRLYGMLDKIEDEGRLAFTLRHFEGYELTEVAEALEVSLATVKRRLARAEEKVYAMAGRDPSLARYLGPHTAASAAGTEGGAS